MYTGGCNIFTAVVLARNPGGEFGGYKARYFINPVELLCGFCRQVPREPQRVPCGHIFCQDCLFTNIITPRQPCSQCHSPVKKEECVADAHLARRVANSSISCPYSEQCEWAGYLSSLTSHFSECVHISAQLRSWMQSIQTHISRVAEESGRLERRVDRLSELVTKMSSRCQAAGYEHEKQLNWIGNQMDYVQQDVLKTPPRRYDPPQRYNPAPFQPPGVHSQDYTSLMIDETEMTESLKLDIAMTRQQMPPTPQPADSGTPVGRNVRFSVYEDHVREDAGDPDVELYEPHDVIMYQNEMYQFPQLRDGPEFKKCLNCDRFNVSTSQRCEFCGKVI